MKNSTFTFLFFFAFILFQTVAYSTTDPIPGAKIDGVVVESGTDLPLPYVTVTLNSEMDSSLVSGTVTDEQGHFEINGISNGKYFIKLSFVGFQPVILNQIEVQSKKEAKSLGQIYLQAAPEVLEEVLVKGRPSPLSSTIEKQVIHADQDLQAAGGTAVDLLKNSPSVRLDHEGNVLLRGSSEYTLLVNGRPSMLDAKELLKQTPAGQIKTIEVITNPPVKYSAEGGAGVINIIMKENKNGQFNGMVNATTGTGKKYAMDAQFNLNWEKTSASVGLNWRDFSRHVNHDYQKIHSFLDTLEYAVMDQDRRTNSQEFGLRLGINREIADDHQLHYAVHTGMNKFAINIGAKTYRITEPLSDTHNKFNTFSLNHKPVFMTHQLVYDTKMGDGTADLSVSAYYSYINYHFYTSQVQSKADDLFQPVDETPYKQDVNNDNFSNDLRFQADLSVPFGKKFTLESGITYQTYLRSLDVQFDQYDHNLEKWISNPLYTNKYDFMESIYGGYSSLKGNLAGIQFTFGLRGEYMDRTLGQKTDDINYDFQNMNWFPSFSISRDMGKMHSFGLAFSNRINRPEEYFLNPFPEFEDEYFYSEGNPNLRPEIVRNLEFNYRMIGEKLTLSSNLFYRITEDKIEQFMVERPDGKLFLGFHNEVHDASLGTEISANLNALKWWSAQGSFTMYRHSIEGIVLNEEISKSNWSWSAQLVNSFRFGRGSSAQLINYYQSRTQSLQYDITSFHFMDLAISQKFLDGRLTVGVQAKDIFRSMNYQLVTKAQNTEMIGNLRNESPVFMLNLSYSINQYEKKTKDVHTEFDMQG
jgi:hypothetical protein